MEGVALPESAYGLTQSVQGAPSCATVVGNLCSTLASFKISNPSLSDMPIGYMMNQTNDARYHMRLIRSIAQDFNLYSLSEALSARSSTGDSPRVNGANTPSRRDRLYLAAVLACSILQLHGTWIKQGWGIEDLHFARDTKHGVTSFDQPYLIWQVSERTSYQSGPTLGNYRVQNEILFPLAIALIELSLGKTLSVMSKGEDEAPDPFQCRLNTASRLLNSVYCKRGSSYRDVVKSCLYWPRNKGECFADSQFDESVFDIVVTPLLKDLAYFEGIGQMR